MTRKEFETLIHGKPLEVEAIVHCPMCGGTRLEGECLAYISESEVDGWNDMLDEVDYGLEQRDKFDLVFIQCRWNPPCQFMAHEAFFVPGRSFPEICRDDHGWYIEDQTGLKLAHLTLGAKWYVTNKEYVLLLRTVNTKCVSELPEVLTSSSEWMRKLAAGMYNKLLRIERNLI